MTVDLALEYIPRRMKELGYADDYSIRFSHFVLQTGEVRQVEASCEFYLLVEEPSFVTIDSDMGIFDLDNTTTNEQQYEHQGNIIITNYGDGAANVRFIQVIPKSLKDKESHEQEGKD